jgi:hypothetical protein
VDGHDTRMATGSHDVGWPRRANGVGAATVWGLPPTRSRCHEPPAAAEAPDLVHHSLFFVFRKCLPCIGIWRTTKQDPCRELSVSIC